MIVKNIKKKYVVGYAGHRVIKWVNPSLLYIQIEFFVRDLYLGTSQKLKKSYHIYYIGELNYGRTIGRCAQIESQKLREKYSKEINKEYIFTEDSNRVTEL